MPADNLLTATNSMRSSVATLKKKLSNLKIQIELFDAEIDKVENKLENILVQADIYKCRIEREAKREVRRLARELKTMPPLYQENVSNATNEIDLKVATSIGIFETILRHMCGTADDFMAASHAFLFPAVYERIMDGSDENYYLPKVPVAAEIVISRGKEHIEWLRQEYETHLTDPETWKDAIDYIVEWWRNDALPLIYGAHDEQWDDDQPFSQQEMVLWRQSATERALHFPKIFDAYEIYRRFKYDIYETSGLHAFEIRYFSYENE